MSVSASACAKFLLGGEHSVVTRGPALSIPLKFLRLNYCESSSGEAGLWLNGAKCEGKDWDRLSELRARIAPEAPSAHRVEIDSKIPLGSGLGSSAALCVAMVRALRPEITQTEHVAALALEGEKLFHAAPSGVDPWTVAFESPLVFRPRPFSHKPLFIDRVFEAGYAFVLRNSLQAHDTAQVQNQVGRTREQTPLLWDDLMDALSTNAQTMIKVIEHDSGAVMGRELGRLMNDSHFRLTSLGVSTDALNEIVKDFRDRGALGAKLTGAGCGGFVVGLFEKEKARETDFLDPSRDFVLDSI